jgi:hypothetical protein
MSPEELVDVELVEPPELDPVEFPAVSPAVVIPVVVGIWPEAPPQAEPRSTTARAFCGKLTTARLSGHSLRAKGAGSGELGRFPGPVAGVDLASRARGGASRDSMSEEVPGAIHVVRRRWTGEESLDDRRGGEWLQSTPLVELRRFDPRAGFERLA